jgi:hypothetical protein
VERALEAAVAISEDAGRAVQRGFSVSAQSSTKTGRLLQPMSADVELRDRARAAAVLHKDGSPTRRFYEGLAADAESMMEYMRKADEELIGGPLS